MNYSVHHVLQNCYAFLYTDMWTSIIISNYILVQDIHYELLYSYYNSPEVLEHYYTDSEVTIMNCSNV